MPDAPEFELTPPETREAVRPKEPLYSMLLECPPETLKYIHEGLCDYRDEASLSDQYPEVGLSRLEYHEQVQLAARTRNILLS